MTIRKKSSRSSAAISAGSACRYCQRANFSFDGAAAEATGEGLRRGGRRRFQSRRAARLDLGAQRRALAVGDRGLARRGRAALVFDGVDRDVAKTGGLQIAADLILIVI